MRQVSGGEGDSEQRGNRTINLIEALYSRRKSKSLVLHPDYLDDEKLPEEERTAVLKEIFNRRIRERQLSRIAQHLTPILDGGYPPAALVYGPTGSGKTVSLLHLLSSFEQVCVRRSIPFRYVYIDLTSPKTYFGALNELSLALDGNGRRYRKGIPIEYMQERIIESLAGYSGTLCLLVDEADNVRPNTDAFLTFLGKTLPRKVSCHLVLVMLTNRLDWEKALDPRILSFLKKADYIFEPYDAVDLFEILKLRVDKALDGSKVDEGALRMIAAHASRETGDARKAVEHLVKSAKIAEETSGRITETEVEQAAETLEIDKTEELIRALAPQQRLTLCACYAALGRSTKRVSTGQVYDVYRTICHRQETKPLTQRRVSDMISFLDLYGLINAPVVSRGRYGQSREIAASLPSNVSEQLFEGRYVP